MRDEWTDTEFFTWVAERRKGADELHDTVGMDGLHRRAHAMLDDLVADLANPEPMSTWRYVSLQARGALLVAEMWLVMTLLPLLVFMRR